MRLKQTGSGFRKTKANPDCFASGCPQCPLPIPCLFRLCEDQANYSWLVTLALELCLEYTHRYGKRHSLQTQIETCFSIIDTIPFVSNELTEFVQAMPEKYRTTDAVTAYRNYYNNEKLRFAKWSKRDRPNWIAA